MRISLGSEQRAVLCLLDERRQWSTDAGWKFGTHTTTESLLKSMVRHDLVVRTGETPDRYGVFEITDAGRVKAKTLRSRK